MHVYSVLFLQPPPVYDLAELKHCDQDQQISDSRKSSYHKPSSCKIISRPKSVIGKSVQCTSENIPPQTVTGHQTPVMEAPINTTANLSSITHNEGAQGAQLLTTPTMPETNRTRVQDKNARSMERVLPSDIKLVIPTNPQKRSVSVSEIIMPANVDNSDMNKLQE